LKEKKVSGGNENFESVGPAWLYVNKLIFNSINGIIEYSINENQKEIDVFKNGAIINSVPENKICNVLDALGDMSSIHAVPLPPFINEMLRAMCYEEIVSNEKDRNSLLIEIYDPRLGVNIRQNFRVISDCEPLFSSTDSDATVENIYSTGIKFFNELVDEFGFDNYTDSSIVRNSKDIGFVSFRSYDVVSEITHGNLELIDSRFPDLFLKIVKHHFTSGIGNLKVHADMFHKSDVLGYGKTHISYYEYKIKKFLKACVMGMTLTEYWDGMARFDGVLTIKKNGDILEYRPYNFDKFEDLLIKHAVVDTYMIIDKELLERSEFPRGERFLKIGLKNLVIKL
jgi:hypothetical protein